MQVKDVMTKDVAVVFEETPFKEVAERMEGHHVGAVPVLSDRGLVGVVSEADLLPKADHDRPQRRHWFQLWRSRGEARKARALYARDLMSSPALAIAPEATVSRAADGMREHHVKSLSVVDASGKLVGIVSGSDLLKVFARSDEEIKQEIEHEVLQRTMALPPGQVKVRVDEGVVRLEGQVDLRSEVPLLAHAVADVDGVVGVDNKVGYRRDDRRENLDLFAGGLVLPPW